MKIDRMELADIGNPVKIAEAILKQLPDIKPPVPIAEIAHALGIVDIKAIETSEFEGCLIADGNKTYGSILLNSRSNDLRQRFTLGHELGHFTNPWHSPTNGRFSCQSKGMIASTFNKDDVDQKMESEANGFAVEILMPSHFVRQDLRRLTGVEIDHIVSLADKYQVSKEAMARRYIEFQEEPCALIFSKDGKISYPYKHKDFPNLKVWNRDIMPPGSLTARQLSNSSSSSQWVEHDADVWLSSNHFETVYEQILAQENGFQITLLTLGDEKDEDEEAINRSWNPRFRK